MGIAANMKEKWRNVALVAGLTNIHGIRPGIFVWPFF